MFEKKILKDFYKNKDQLIKNHVYNENDEHSSCGVGLIASIKNNSYIMNVTILF